MHYRYGARSKNQGGGNKTCGGYNLPPGRDRVNLCAKVHGPAVFIKEHS